MCSALCRISKICVRAPSWERCFAVAKRANCPSPIQNRKDPPHLPLTPPSASRFDENMLFSACWYRGTSPPDRRRFPMRRIRCIRMAALAAALAISSVALAQSHPEYIRLGQVNAALYKPDSGPAPHVAFLVAHRTANYMGHIGCREFSARGFLVLCFNTRFQNNEAAVRWEETALDVKAAVD